ncbi:unnamed protein product [Ectocarpus sp. CCAP 1310/34]|nr:unnamed protein product [Ectocarpus sp. CCAP 1310/34]
MQLQEETEGHPGRCSWPWMAVDAPGHAGSFKQKYSLPGRRQIRPA